MVHVTEGSEETDSGGGAIGGGDGLESLAAASTGRPCCTCNLSPETQDLLRQVFKDIVRECITTVYWYDISWGIWHSVVSCNVAYMYM